MQRPFDFDAHMQYEALVGSHAYRTAEPDAPKRYVSIIVPERLIELGLKPFESWRSLDKRRTVHSLRRFGRMLVNSNISAYEALFVDTDLIRYAGPIGVRLRRARESLLSLELADQYANEADISCEEILSYREGDETSRELVERHGYNTKAAMRALRCYRMAREISEGRGLLVGREDGPELLAVRRGEYRLEELAIFDESETEIDLKDGLIARERDAFDEAREKSKVQESPNARRLSDLVATMTYEMLETYESEKPQKTDKHVDGDIF